MYHPFNWVKLIHAAVAGGRGGGQPSECAADLKEKNMQTRPTLTSFGDLLAPFTKI